MKNHYGRRLIPTRSSFGPAINYGMQDNSLILRDTDPVWGSVEQHEKELEELANGAAGAYVIDLSELAPIPEDGANPELVLVLDAIARLQRQT